MIVRSNPKPKYTKQPTHSDLRATLPAGDEKRARSYTLELRSGFQPGQHLSHVLRKYGVKGWDNCNGEPSYVSTWDAGVEAGKAWLAE